MNNAMQLKAIMKNMSKDKHISAQLILQNYILERLLEPRSIKILAYNLETILAEKLETIISRGDQNTRPRDYYDVFIIRQLQWQNVNADSIYAALMATAENRNTRSLMEQYPEILKTINNSPTMHQHWINYQNQFDYAKDIEFNDILTVILDILNSMDWPQRKT